MKGNLDSLFNNLNEVGRSWASYGLTMGRAALETSAVTLKSTAEFLGEVSAKLNQKPAHDPTQEPTAK